MERLHFSDMSLAFDINGNAGQTYRLYQAALNRTPDAGGLGYWIHAMDEGSTLQQVAGSFLQSSEFQGLYGANPSNTQFVTLLYSNVLHRAPDQGGLDWWLGQLSGGAQTRAGVLAGFSESAENQAALLPVLQNGIVYTPALSDGTSGNDQLLGNAAANTLNGLAGNDTITPTVSGLTVADTTGVDGTDTLTNLERLQFPDTSLAFDINGNAGQAYRIYQAALNRIPEKAGLSYWIKEMDGGMTLQQVAHGFISSTEFQNMMGANPTDTQFVNQMYSNVLHRAPDAGGAGYWLNQLHAGTTREAVLMGFSESAENQAALIGVIQGGIEYLA